MPLGMPLVCHWYATGMPLARNYDPAGHRRLVLGLPFVRWVFLLLPPPSPSPAPSPPTLPPTNS